MHGSMQRHQRHKRASGSSWRRAREKGRIGPWERVWKFHARSSGSKCLSANEEEVPPTAPLLQHNSTPTQCLFVPLMPHTLFFIFFCKQRRERRKEKMLTPDRLSAELLSSASHVCRLFRSLLSSLPGNMLPSQARQRDQQSWRQVSRRLNWSWSRSALAADVANSLSLSFASTNLLARLPRVKRERGTRDRLPLH